MWSPGYVGSRISSTRRKRRGRVGYQLQFVLCVLYAVGAILSLLHLASAVYLNAYNGVN
jgi:DMSO reductase anchor subunit